MNTQELIPVLKALHADPGCAPMMADWFEERGMEDVARWLRVRTGVITSGNVLLDAMCNLGNRRGELFKAAIVADWFTSNLYWSPERVVERWEDGISRGFLLDAEPREWVRFHPGEQLSEVVFALFGPHMARYSVRLERHRLRQRLVASDFARCLCPQVDAAEEVWFGRDDRADKWVVSPLHPRFTPVFSSRPS